MDNRLARTYNSYFHYILLYSFKRFYCRIFLFIMTIKVLIRHVFEWNLIFKKPNVFEELVPRLHGPSFISRIIFARIFIYQLNQLNTVKIPLWQFINRVFSVAHALPDPFANVPLNKIRTLSLYRVKISNNNY